MTEDGRHHSTRKRRGRYWIPLTALLLTLATAVFQTRTGPTYPLQGEFQTTGGRVRFFFARSEVIGRDLPIVLLAPVPDELRGRVRYRRYRSADAWTTVDMRPGSFFFHSRGVSRTLKGLGVMLPSLRERAGKYEYFVEVAEADGPFRSVTGEKPVYARYKARVPGEVLVLHIVVIFASLYLAMLATLLALTGGTYRRTLTAAVAALLLGGFVLGPLVQWYAFGVWWSGFPLGYDWTDNKVVVELLFWLGALWANRGQRRRPWTVVLAGIVTLAVFLVPHSIFGSEYNYLTGTGHGTAG